MGFNKRYLSFDNIISFSKNEFVSFHRYLTGADAYITSDKESSNFLNDYWSSSEEKQKELHKKLQNEKANSIS